MDSVATLDQNFCTLLAEFTAGEPMRQGVLWTNCSGQVISDSLIGFFDVDSRSKALVRAAEPFQPILSL